VTGAAAARRTALAAAALALVVILVAWASRVQEGRRSLAAADAALQRGDPIEAIVLARATAEARCPLCEAPELGYARLYAIAKDAEGRGEDATAVAAWRAVRAATLATSILDTSPARRERADVEIARLEHRIDLAAAAAGGTPSPAAAEETLRVALTTSTVPSGTVFSLLAIGGALFAAGAFRFVRASAVRWGELAIALAGGAVAAAAVLFF